MKNKRLNEILAIADKCPRSLIEIWAHPLAWKEVAEELLSRPPPAFIKAVKWTAYDVSLIVQIQDRFAKFVVSENKRDLKLWGNPSYLASYIDRDKTETTINASDLFEWNEDVTKYIGEANGNRSN